ncbi:MAG: hypothetical protein WEB04_09210 [Dehalococcoidia bacterium]
MNAATKSTNNISRLDNSEWLVRLLSDVQRDVAAQPSALAVERMRARLAAGMYAQEKAAA